jgi:hypothetical protein
MNRQGGREGNIVNLSCQRTRGGVKVSSNIAINNNIDVQNIKNNNISQIQSGYKDILNLRQ